MPGDVASVGKLAVELGLNAEEFARMMAFVEGVTEGAREELEKYKSELGRTEKQVQSGEKALRGFFREQRLQDRTLREITQSVSQLAFGIAFLTQGNENAGATAKKVGDSLLVFATTLNTVELAGFGVARMASTMTGTLGMIFQGVSKIMGPIGWILAAGSALWTFFQKTNQEASKAAKEGLKEYTAAIEAAAAAQDKLTAQVVQARETVYRQGIARVDAQIELLKKLMERMRDAAARGVPLVVSDVEAAEVRAATGIVNIATITTEQIEEIIYGTIEVYRKRGKELDKEGLAIIEGLLNRRRQLTASLLALDTTAEGTRPGAVTEAEARAEAKKAEDARKESLKNIAEFTTASIADEYTARERAIEDEYRQRVQAADDAVKIHKDASIRKREIDAAELARKKALADLGVQIEEKRAATEHELLLAEAGLKKDEYDKAIAVADENYRRATELAKARYDKENDAQVYTSELAKALFEKQAAYAEALKTQSEKKLALEQQQFEALGTVIQSLTSAFVTSTNTAFSKLMALLQLAIRVALQIKMLNAATAAGTGIGALGPISMIAGLFGGVASIFGGHQKGGYTGPGPASQPAGIVHADEFVFEKALTRRALPELFAMRAAMQRGASFSRAASSAGGGSDELVAEVRALRGDVRALEIQQPVVFKNVLDTQKIVREELPGASAYQKRKTL